MDPEGLENGLSGTSGTSTGEMPSPAPEETPPHAAVSTCWGPRSWKAAFRKECEVLLDTELNTSREHTAKRANALLSCVRRRAIVQ